MSDHAIEPTRLADLRSRAASRLTGGATAKGAPERITDALSALYTLASSPQTASDALALLHELQVHQVELDLQAQELLDSRAELEWALRRQMEVHDLLPVGCFTIDAHLVVNEMNQAASEMLGLERGEHHEVDWDDFLCAASRATLKSLVERATTDVRMEPCLLKLRAPDGAERDVQADVRAERGAHRFLLVLTYLAEGRRVSLAAG
jgi:PAS domain-containing protein